MYSKRTIKTQNDRNSKNYRRKVKSYFDKEEERNGQDWIMKKDQKLMEKEVKSIIRDLVRCNIDIEQHGHYFTNHLILSCMIKELEMQYRRHYVLHYSLDFLLKSNMGLPNYYAGVEHEEHVLSSMYYKLLDTFTKIKVTGDVIVHLNNLYVILNNHDGKFFIGDDMLDFLKET